MYSQTIIIGHVGRDAELRYTPTGIAVCNFNVAVNRVWKDANGNKQEDTTWWRVTCWRRLAEVASEYVKRGDLVTVIGEQVKASGYADKNGAIAASLDITASQVKFMGGKQNTAEQHAPAAPDLRQPSSGNDITF